MAEERVRVLSDEDVAKVRAWFFAKNVSRNCESCGRGNLMPGPVVRGIGLTLGEGGVKDWDNPSVATLQMVCENCGYVRHYSAGLMGLL